MVDASRIGQRIVAAIHPFSDVVDGDFFFTTSNRSFLGSLTLLVLIIHNLAMILREAYRLFSYELLILGEHCGGANRSSYIARVVYLVQRVEHSHKL